MFAPHQQIDGKYEILEKIREGGMGAVYRVRHRLLDEVRVIKVMRPHLEGDAYLEARFLREAKLAVKLRHPNIAQLYDFSMDDDGTAYIVLEFIHGMTLEEMLRRCGPLPVALSLEVARQTLSALGYLHQRGFIHRDIAPDNLMLSEDTEGRPLIKLLDLGIAKMLEEGAELRLTGAGTFLGKMRYASPEQFSEGGNAPVEPASDLYSFGIVLYELMTGVHPVPGHDASAVIAGHLFRPPLDFDSTDPENHIPRDLRRIVMQMLAKKPTDRPASAEAATEALAQVQSRYQLPDNMVREIMEQAHGTSPGEARSAVDPGSTQVRLNERFAAVETPPPQKLPGDKTPAEPADAVPERTAFLEQLPDGSKPAPPTTGGSGTTPGVNLNQTAVDLLASARRFLHEGRLEEARLHVEAALEVTPGNPEAVELRQAVAAAQGAAGGGSGTGEEPAPPAEMEPTEAASVEQPTAALSAEELAALRRLDPRSTDAEQVEAEPRADSDFQLSPEEADDLLSRLGPPEPKAGRRHAGGARPTPPHPKPPPPPAADSPRPEVASAGRPAAHTPSPPPPRQAVAPTPQEPPPPPARTPPPVPPGAGTEPGASLPAATAVSELVPTSGEEPPPPADAGDALAPAAAPPAPATPFWAQFIQRLSPLIDRLHQLTRRLPQLIHHLRQLTRRLPQLPPVLRSPMVLGLAAIGLLAVVVVVVSLVLLLPGPPHRETPQAVAAQPPPAPEPAPAPAEEPAPDVTPVPYDEGLSQIFELLGEDDEAAWLQLVALNERQHELSERDCQVLEILESTLGQALRQRIDDNGPLLRSALAAGDPRQLRAAVEALPRDLDVVASLNPELTGPLSQARRFLTLHGRLWAAHGRRDYPRVLTESRALLAAFPQYTGAADLRQQAAAALETEAEELAGRGRFDEAMARLGTVRQEWPERPGVEAKIRRLRGEASTDEVLEATLMAAEQALAQGRPEVGLDRLRAAAPNRRYQERFDALEERLARRLAEVDAQSPTVRIASGTELRFRKDEAVTIPLEVADDHRIRSARAWVLPEGGEVQEVPLRPAAAGGGRYELTIPADLHGNKDVAFYAQVVDYSGHIARLGSPETPIEIERRRWWRP